MAVLHVGGKTIGIDGSTRVPSLAHSSKLKKDLGWSPEESFQTGIEKTLSWYLDHQSWTDRVRSGAYQDWIREHYEKEDD